MENLLIKRTPKTWKKICITVSKEVSESVTSFLADLTGSGVECSQEDDRKETIIGYLETDQSIQEKEKKLTLFLNDLVSLFPDSQSPSLRVETIQEEDWGKKWKEHFKPFRVGRNLVIKPTWEEYHPNKGEGIIELDPGMAFGTGHHASTKMALELIEKAFDKTIQETVLDVGTGTGILAMACAALGAKDILAIDNDPDAVIVARDNIEANSFSTIIQVNNTPLSDIPAGFALVCANITHNTLINMASELYRCTNQNGTLILSGILQGEQQQNIINKYNALGFILSETLYEAEWTALSFIKE